MLTCFTREVSPALGDCELTHAPRQSVDVELARIQHAAYEDALRALGAHVERLSPAPRAPDGVFVEDTALVLPEVAVILRPGAPSRRIETTSVAKALGAFRELRTVRSPGTIDGGDVLRVGKKLFVGRSSRTNADGIDQLSTVVDEFGYEVFPVEIRDCLHLKSAVTQIGPNLLLVNRDWLLDFPFGNMEMIDVDPDEPAAANALMINGTVIYPVNFPATAERMRHRGVRLAAVDVSEIQKAEGGVTCCCIPLW